MRKLALSMAAAACLMAVPSYAEVRLTIHDGLVSLNAEDATLRQILAEWGRVGQTKIVNGDRVPGGPLTLQFTDVPEAQALEMLLRTVSGYLAAPRATAQSSVSRFDRIVVMPTAATPPRPGTYAAAPAPTPPPPFPQPRFNPQLSGDDLADDATRGGQVPILQPNVVRPNPPVFNPFPNSEAPVPFQPGAAPVTPPAASPPASAITPTPTAAPGASVPGVIIPPPSQPGQPGQQPVPVPPGQ
jgi:hypothetical protein